MSLKYRFIIQKDSNNIKRKNFFEIRFNIWNIDFLFNICDNALNENILVWNI